MTTKREQIDAAIKDATNNWTEDTTFIERFYAIAFEAGRVVEREEIAALVEDSDSDEPDPRDLVEAIRARGDRK